MSTAERIGALVGIVGLLVMVLRLTFQAGQLTATIGQMEETIDRMSTQLEVIRNDQLGHELQWVEWTARRGDR